MTAQTDGQNFYLIPSMDKLMTFPAQVVSRSLVLVSAVFFFAVPFSLADEKTDIQRDVMVAMRDGVKLANDLYLPARFEGRLPTVLIRTPYGKSPKWAAARVKPFVERGYAIVMQDKRARFASEGDKYYPQIGDADDGYDTIEWISTRDWSNGRVGMIGCSYPGDVQLLAAQRLHPALKAIVPQAAGSVIGSMNGDYKYFGVRLSGTIELAQGLAWFYSDAVVRKFFKDNPEIPKQDIKTLWWHLPVNDITRFAGIPDELTTFNTITTTPVTDPWWDQFFYMGDDYRSDVPALHVNSWYDFGARETIMTYEHMRATSLSRKARDNQFMIMSPTAHCGSERAVSEQTVVGDREMGDARFPHNKIYMDWFDFWLKGDREGDYDMPAVQYFLMGKNEWRKSDQWPIPGTRMKKLYLHSAGEANSRFGNGSLSFEPPAEEPPDQFIYDPAVPVPTKGGPVCCTGPNSPAGSFDQRDIESRHDVLVYSTKPLDKGIEVTGKLDALLYVSSSAKDTDFTVKLIDVYPDGRAFNVQEGILRARYREGQHKEVWMKPGGVYPLLIDVDATSNYFAKGHRIRLEISSSNFPRFDRNLNTGGRNFDEVEGVIARNTLHHSKKYPSHIVLPVVE